ncbi:glycosyltransferase family 61 protein [Rhizobium terrae]|uniref:glycosyltransferase family 61 protein n=1 Tax=Rhizobium terrae TaxID=2171756 RepID=UPI0013C32754|nr:glycosyltransferase family 61 protein [Rhizobium terrae]
MKAADNSLARIFDTTAYTSAEMEEIEYIIGFDRAFYREKYPDVNEAGMDVLDHYLRYGVNEGRKPAEESAIRIPGGNRTWLEDIIGFDQSFYARTYPDVDSRYPDHLVRYGLREGRIPFDFHDNLLPEQVLWSIMDQLHLNRAVPLEHCAQLDATAWKPLVKALTASAAQLSFRPKPNRNNYWLALAIGYLARGELGASACCYNFFFNAYIPNHWLGNARQRMVGTGRIVKVAEAVASFGDVLATPKVATSTIVQDPVFLNRPLTTLATVDLPLPEPVYGTLSNVEVIGATSLIVQSAHNVFYDYTETGPRARELQCPNIIHLIEDRCSYYLPVKSWSVDEAYWMLHDHGSNYHHWLLEVLPRYLLARENGLSPSVPLLVDNNMPAQLKEILAAVFGGPPPLIEVTRDAAVKVGCLHVATDICVTAVHTEREPLPGDMLISSTAIKMLRALAKPYFRDVDGTFENVHIIRRNVTHRRLVNRQNVEAAMNEAGLWGFDPGEASWAQQVAVFSNARLIVAEAGASLANLVFCHPGATVIVLVSGHPYSNFFYLCQLAKLTNVRLFFLECLRLDNTHPVGVQEDMIAPLGVLNTWVKRFLADPNYDPADDINEPVR